jgi:cytochrome P450
MPIATRRNGLAPVLLPLDEIDLGSWEFWGQPDDVRDAAFATLRAKAPISRQNSPQLPDFPPQDMEHWALTRHEDVWWVSRHPQLFSSWPSIVIGDTPEEIAEFFGSMIVLDDPRHFRLRSIVQKAFTPKMITQVEEFVRARARRLVETMVRDHPDGTCDLVEALSGPLPLQVICDMMGIPEEDVEKIFRWTNVILGTGDPDIATDYNEFFQVAQDMAAYGVALADDRRAHPQNDLTTNLVSAELDGERLSDIEVASFFILLAAAGNETTRNAISHGIVALTRYPDERT